MDMDEHRRKRLQALVDQETNGNVSAFARNHGQDATRLRQILNPNYRAGRSFGEGAARRLEDAIGLPKLFFDFGIEESLDETHNSASADTKGRGQNTDLIGINSAKSGLTISKNDASPGPAIQGSVPLVSWDQARTWDKLMHSFAESDAERWLLCPVPHSAGTFCLRNDTETMDDGTRDGYGEGDILFVDPEVEPEPGKDVIVIIPSGKMLFRRLKEDSEGRYLLALNGRRIERWQDGTLVRGVVIFSGMFR
jgi:SOS-response transcriptional repressor LexA